MRIRSLVAAFGAATLLAALTAAPASAGTGASMWCSDNNGYLEIPVLTSPVTVGLELYHAPGVDHQTLVLCYSTSAEGEPATVTSGAITVDIRTNTGTTSPGAYVELACAPDFATGVGPACVFVNSANVMPGNVNPSTADAFCLVAVGSGCVAYVPGVRVTDSDPRPLLSIQVLSNPVNVDTPKCIAVLLACP